MRSLFLVQAVVAFNMQWCRTQKNSVATLSSSDLGAASHEMRHMIDADFLRSLGNGLFESIVPAVPTVSVVRGANMDDVRCAQRKSNVGTGDTQACG